MRIIYDTVTNDAGTVIRNASVELLTQEGDPVEIFADKDGNTSLGTSITTDDNGFFQFFAPDGSEYSLRFSYGQISRTVRGIDLYDFKQMRDDINAATTGKATAAALGIPAESEKMGRTEGGILSAGGTYKTWRSEKSR